MLGAEVPTFNIGGQDRVRTYTGGLVSLAILAATFLFAMLKWQVMFLKKSPEIVRTTDESGISSDDLWDLSVETDFQIAVGIKNQGKGFLNDPRYVQWVVNVEEQVDGGKPTAAFYPLHPCTQDDFAKFYPIEPRAKGAVDKLKQSGGLYCIDWETAELPPLSGHWRTDQTYTSYDVQAVPCQMRFKTPNGKVVEPRNDCVQGKNQLMDYLGSTLQILVYYNKETFLQDQFGEESIYKSSSSIEMQTDATVAHFIETFIQKQELVDETSLLQFGQFQSTEFQDVIFKTPQKSNFDAWPTRANPEAHYKIVGLFTELSQSLITTERQTYSSLEWLGDIGGLHDGLLLLATFIISPIANLALQFSLFTDTRTADAESDNSYKSFFLRQSLIGLCWNRKQSQRQRLLVSRAESSIENQLDLIKFFHRMRTLMIATFITLDNIQLAKVKTLSKREGIEQISSVDSEEDKSDDKNDGHQSSTARYKIANGMTMKKIDGRLATLTQLLIDKTEKTEKASEEKYMTVSGQPIEQLEPQPHPLSQQTPQVYLDEPQPQLQIEPKPKPQVKIEPTHKPQVQIEPKLKPQVQIEPQPKPQVQFEPQLQSQISIELQPLTQPQQQSLHALSLRSQISINVVEQPSDSLSTQREDNDQLIQMPNNMSCDMKQRAEENSSFQMELIDDSVVEKKRTPRV